MTPFKVFCHIILAIITSGGLSMVHAKVPDMINLLQSYELALSSDPVFRGANDQRLASEEAIPTAVSGFLPFVNAQAQQQSTLVDNAFLFQPNPVLPFINRFGYYIAGTELVRTATYSGTVQQSLFNLSNWHTLKQAYRIKDTAEANYVNAGQDLILRTASAYFQVLNTIDNLNFVTAEKDAIEQQLTQTNEKFKVGLVAITDVKELEAQRDAIRAQQIEAYNRIQSAREALRVIIGIFPDKLAALEENMPLTSPAPNDSDTWAGIAEESNPNLQAARYNSEVQKQSVNIAKDQNLPTLSFSGNLYKQRYGTWAEPILEASHWQWSALLTAQLNIFSGGAITASIHKAQYTYQQSLEALEKTRRDVVKAAEDAFRNVETSLSSVKAYSKSVLSNQIAVDATIAGYNVGTRTSVDVLTEISNLYEQQKNLANARYAYILSILSLKKAAGILSLQDILDVNKMLLTTPAVIIKEKLEREEIQKFIDEPSISVPLPGQSLPNISVTPDVPKTPRTPEPPSPTPYTPTPSPSATIPLPLPPTPTTPVVEPIPTPTPLPGRTTTPIFDPPPLFPPKE